MPSFEREVSQAYEEMTSLESPNDFFVSSFVQGTAEQLGLFAKGRGGLAKVKEILLEHFQDEVAVAMFRITAVDDRGKVKSFRTKLVHVVYIGPKTPVMKRAKVGPWNAAFKQPFTMNLSIQTDDVDGDLSEASLERSLRASGGAHQPTCFDFANTEGGSGSLENSQIVSPSPKASAPSSPSNKETPTTFEPARSYQSVWEEHLSSFNNRDSAELARLYAEDGKFVYTNLRTGSVSVAQQRDEIKDLLERVFEDFRDDFDLATVESAQKDSETGTVFAYWVSAQGNAAGAHTLSIINGKIVLHTLVVSHKEAIEQQQPSAEETGSQATAENDDTVASDAAVASQEAVSEQPDELSRPESSDDYVDVDQAPEHEEAADEQDQTEEFAEGDEGAADAANNAGDEAENAADDNE